MTTTEIKEALFLCAEPETGLNHNCLLHEN